MEILYIQNRHHHYIAILHAVLQWKSLRLAFSRLWLVRTSLDDVFWTFSVRSV